MEARGRRPSIPHLGASGLDLIFPVSYLTGLNLSWKTRRARRNAEDEHEGEGQRNRLDLFPVQPPQFSAPSASTRATGSASEQLEGPRARGAHARGVLDRHHEAPLTHDPT